MLMFVLQGGVDSWGFGSGEIISTGYKSGTKWNDITILSCSLQQKDPERQMFKQFSVPAGAPMGRDSTNLTPFDSIFSLYSGSVKEHCLQMLK